MISAIRLQISVNEGKCCRKIALKGLYGDPGKLSEFTQAFKVKIQESVENLPSDPKGRSKKGAS
jgi:hypothetical protein